MKPVTAHIIMYIYNISSGLLINSMGAVYTLRSGQHNIYTADVTPLGTSVVSNICNNGRPCALRVL